MSVTATTASAPEARVDLDIQGLVFDLDTFAIHDGPGIRMTVYFKGCPLACAWCHSPESRGRGREVILVRERCVQCGACVVACAQGVHALVGGRHTLARERCMACGACVAACAQEALAMKGYFVSAGDIVRRARRMAPFFEHSGGGVTLTGGEVTLQPAFAAAVLAGCRAEGIHTAIETSGACAWETLERLVAHTDLVLYDLKLMDEAAHRRWVGASNRQTLENAARLARVGVPVQARVPLIPAITDTEANLRATYAFCAEVGLCDVSLLPYNEAASAKYEWLDAPYPIEGARQSESALAAMVALGREMGVDAHVDA